MMKTWENSYVVRDVSPHSLNFVRRYVQKRHDREPLPYGIYDTWYDRFVWLIDTVAMEVPREEMEQFCVECNIERKELSLIDVMNDKRK
jgi:hypothetical protein